MTKRVSTLVFLFALVAAVLLVYVPGLQNELVFDDARLTDGTVFGNYGHLLEIKRRMLSYGSFVWVQNLLGEGWWKQRLLNVVLHLLMCWSLYLLVQTLLSRVHAVADTVAASRVAVILFAVNPVAVYAVAYLVQRSTVMATLFVVLACYCFTRALARQQRGWFVLALAGYVMAVLAKETMVVAGALVLPLYIYMVRPSWQRALAISALALLLLAVGVALLVFTMGSYVGILGTIFDENSRFFKLQLEAIQPGISAQIYPLSIVNQMTLFFCYGFLWFVPNVQWLSVDIRPAYPLTLTAFPQIVGLIGFALALCGSAWLVLRRSDKWGLVGLCILMPQLLYFTEFATVWVQDPFVLYRSYQWAFTIPCMIALVFLLVPPKAIYPIGFVVGALFAGLAIDRTLSFQNDLSIWTDAAEKIDLKASANAVGRWRPFMNRGTFYLDRSTPDLAYRDFAQADGLGEPYGAARFSMGTSLQLENKYREAIAAFNAAEKVGFTEAALYFQRGESYAALGQIAEAFENYSLALTKPQAPEAEDFARMRRGEVAVPLQRYDEAIKDFNLLLAKKPDDRRLQMGLGMAYVGKHDAKAAIALFSQVLAVRSLAPAYFGRGLAYADASDKVSGLKDLDQAIALMPNNPVYRAQREKMAAGK